MGAARRAGFFFFFLLTQLAHTLARTVTVSFVRSRLWFLLVFMHEAHESGMHGTQCSIVFLREVVPWQPVRDVPFLARHLCDEHPGDHLSTAARSVSSM